MRSSFWDKNKEAEAVGEAKTEDKWDKEKVVIERLGAALLEKFGGGLVLRELAKTGLPETRAETVEHYDL